MIATHLEPLRELVLPTSRGCVTANRPRGRDPRPGANPAWDELEHQRSLEEE